MKNWLRFTRRQSHPRLRWGQLLTIISTFLVIGLVLAIASPAHASYLSDAWNQTYNIIFEGTTQKEVFGAIMGIISAIAFYIGNECLSIVQDIILPGGSSLLFGPAMQTAWKSVMEIANVLFFVALLVFSIMIITRQAGYNFKKAVTALLLAVALANLSFNIGRLIVDMGDALRNLANTLPGLGLGADSTAWGAWFKQWGNTFWEGSNITESVAHYAFRTSVLAASQIIVAYTFFRLAILLIERIVRIALLVIFAPVQAAFSILPAKELQSVGSNWIGELIKWTLVLPLTFMLIALAQLFIPAPAALRTITQQIGNGQAPDTLTLVGSLAGIAILIAAIQVPKILNVPVLALTKSVMNYPGQLAQSAWKATSGAVRAGVGVQLGIAGEKLKNAPIIGNAYRAFSDLRQRSQTRLETLRKTNEAAAAVRNLRPMETATEATQIRYEAGMQKFWLDKNPTKSPTDYANLPLADKAKIKEDYAAAHPVAAMEYAAAGRTQKVTLAERRKLAEEIGYPLETAREQLKELFGAVEGGDKTASTRDELKQLFAYAIKQADSNAPGAVGWKIAMNSFLENKDRMSLLTRPTIEGGLGYAYKLVDHYDVTDQARRRYEETAATRDIGNAYTTFAQADQKLKDFDAGLKFHSMSIDADVNQTIRLMDTQTLQLITDKTTRDLLKSLDATKLTAIQTQLDKDIGAIMRRMDLSASAKEVAVEQLLNTKGYTTEAKTVADLLVNKQLNLQSLPKGPGATSIVNVAKQYDTHAEVNPQIHETIQSRRENERRSAAQQRIDRIESGDSFDKGIADYLSAGTTSKTDLINRLNDRIAELNTSVAKSGLDASQKARGLEAHGLSPVTSDDLVKLVNDIHAQFLKPGTANIGGGRDNFLDEMTIEDTYNLLYRGLHAAEKR